MKTKLLLLLSLFVSSVCFGRVTYKIEHTEFLPHGGFHMQIVRFDSVTSKMNGSGLLRFEHKEVGENETKRNKAELEVLKSFLRKHYVNDSNPNDFNIKIIDSSSVELSLEEYFFCNGFVMTEYTRTKEKLSYGFELIQIYFFTKE